MNEEALNVRETTAETERMSSHTKREGETRKRRNDARGRCKRAKWKSTRLHVAVFVRRTDCAMSVSSTTMRNIGTRRQSIDVRS